MVFVPAVFRKVNPLTVQQKWKVLSAATFRNFSSGTGFSQEEIEKFRKVFRTLPSYEETIVADDLVPFYYAINFNRPVESFFKHVDYTNKILGGRIELAQFMKYLATEHDPRLLMNEYIKTFDRNNDGYISKGEFEIGIEDVKSHDPRVKNVSYELY